MDELIPICDVIGDPKAKPPIRGILPGASRSFLYELIKARKIAQPVKVGRRTYFRRSDLERWMRDLEPVRIAADAPVAPGAEDTREAA